MTISDLQGKWVLESISGDAVETPSEIYFKIDERTISGFDGCNHFGGPLDAPQNLRMTQRACAEEGPSLPLDLAKPLAQLESAHLEADTLELDLPDETGKASFRRAQEEQ
ncbi:MAG: META domain-containing protein [Thermoanaerobaculia bacterium]